MVEKSRTQQRTVRVLDGNVMPAKTKKATVVVGSQLTARFVLVELLRRASIHPWPLIGSNHHWLLTSLSSLI